MAKPIGPTCNLDCRYCYYIDKDRLYPETRRFRMSDRLLNVFIRDYVAAHEGPEIRFLWQGGEPTLLGLKFFRKVVELQQRHCPTGKTIHNALQTNGTLLDRRWAAFLRNHGFLVGLSIDGPRKSHDRYRVNHKGQPTFDTVLGALRLLREENVEFNTLHRGPSAQRASRPQDLPVSQGRGRPLHAVHPAGGALRRRRNTGRPANVDR